MPTQNYTTKHTSLQTENEQKSVSNDGLPEPTLNLPVQNYINSLEPIPQGKRNASMYQHGLTFRTQGYSGDALVLALSEVNQTKCTPPLPDEEIARIAQSVDGAKKVPLGKQGTTRNRRKPKKASTPRYRTVYAIAKPSTSIPVADLLQKKISAYRDCFAKNRMALFPLVRCWNGSELIRKQRN